MLATEWPTASMKMEPRLLRLWNGTVPQSDQDLMNATHTATESPSWLRSRTSTDTLFTFFNKFHASKINVFFIWVKIELALLDLHTLSFLYKTPRGFLTMFLFFSSRDACYCCFMNDQVDMQNKITYEMPLIYQIHEFFMSQLHFFKDPM